MNEGHGKGIVGNAAVLASHLLMSAVLSGCVVVGHRNGGGWFIWPGGLGLFLVILLLFPFLRRR